MLDLRRSVLCLALFGLVLGLVPAQGQFVLDPTPIPNPGFIVERVGAGPTIPAAREMALDSIREDYMILSYTSSGGRCTPIVGSNEQLCSVRVTARVLPRPGTFPL